MKLTIHGFKDIVDNKYFDLYSDIIINRILNPIIKGTEYTESHHILPRSLGGDNSSDNLVVLSFREHYICHYLLTKCIINKSYYKMLTAFMAMNMCSNTTSKRTINSKLYAATKKKYGKVFSDVMRDRWNNPLYREKTTASIKNSWYNGLRDDQLKYMKENSPFNNPEIHKKTIESRTKNVTNVWITNNPMKDPVKAKQIAQSRSGKNHYLTKTRLYYYKHENDSDWQLLDPDLTIQQLCKQHCWSVATFNYILNGKIPKRGSMKGISIKKVILE